MAGPDSLKTARLGSVWKCNGCRLKENSPLDEVVGFGIFTFAEYYTIRLRLLFYIKLLEMLLRLMQFLVIFVH